MGLHPGTDVQRRTEEVADQRRVDRFLNIDDRGSISVQNKSTSMAGTASAPRKPRLTASAAAVTAVTVASHRGGAWVRNAAIAIATRKIANGYGLSRVAASAVFVSRCETHPCLVWTRDSLASIRQTPEHAVPRGVMGGGRNGSAGPCAC
jgi:hypothetical protein